MLDGGYAYRGLLNYHNSLVEARKKKKKTDKHEVLDALKTEILQYYTILKLEKKKSFSLL
jgi:hypothetical protein